VLRPSVLRATVSADLRGPFDVIGDVHGCFDELVELLTRLGYTNSDGVFRHASRRALFLGDLADRGPRSLACVELVMRMLANLAHLESTSGAAIDNPFARSISGTWTPGTSPATVAQRCPETGSASFDYESDGEQVTLRFGPLSALPGTSLWTTFVVTRRP
jgi:hypothetical protein